MTIFAIVIGIILVIIMTIYINNKSYMYKMLSVANLVESNIHDLFANNLESKYGEQKAQLIATAITDELFSKSSSEDIKETKNSYKEIMEQELSRIQYNRPLCRLITKAVSVRCVSHFAKKRREKELVFEPIMKLKKYKIFVNLKRPPRFKEFLGSTKKYFDKHNK